MWSAFFVLSILPNILRILVQISIKSKLFKLNEKTSQENNFKTAHSEYLRELFALLCILKILNSGFIPIFFGIKNIYRLCKHRKFLLLFS